MTRRGFSLIELLVVIAIIVVLVTLALPSYHKALLMTHETAAMRTMANIQTAEAQYYALHDRFAAPLGELNGLIQSHLTTTGESSGYKFTLSHITGGYAITAVPTEFGTTGARTFFSDQTLELHEHDGPEPATASDPIVNQSATR